MAKVDTVRLAKHTLSAVQFPQTWVALPRQTADQVHAVLFPAQAPTSTSHGYPFALGPVYPTLIAALEPVLRRVAAYSNTVLPPEWIEEVSRHTDSPLAQLAAYLPRLSMVLFRPIRVTVVHAVEAAPVTPSGQHNNTHKYVVEPSEVSSFCQECVNIYLLVTRDGVRVVHWEAWDSLARVTPRASSREYKPFLFDGEVMQHIR